MVHRNFAIAAFALGLAAPGLAAGAPAGSAGRPWGASAAAPAPYVPAVQLTCIRYGPRGVIFTNKGQSEVPVQTYAKFELAKTNWYADYVGGYLFTTPLAAGKMWAVNTPQTSSSNGNSGPMPDPVSQVLGASIALQETGPCKVLSLSQGLPTPHIGAWPH